MTGTTTHAPRSDPLVRTAAHLCLWAGVLGAASGIVLATVDPAVPETQWSYPQSVRDFTLTQLWFCVQHLGLLAGLLVLPRSGVLGHDRLARLGLGAAVVGMAGLTVTEVVAILPAEEATADPFPAALGAAYGVWTLLCGGGLVAAGVAVRRHGAWTGWRAGVVLVAGIWVFVPMLPAIGLSFVGARLAITGWMLLFAALGWALLSGARAASVADNHVPRVAAG